MNLVYLNSTSDSSIFRINSIQSDKNANQHASPDPINMIGSRQFNQLVVGVGFELALALVLALVLAVSLCFFLFFFFFFLDVASPLAAARLSV